AVCSRYAGIELEAGVLECRSLLRKGRLRQDQSERKGCRHLSPAKGSDWIVHFLFPLLECSGNSQSANPPRMRLHSWYAFRLPSIFRWYTGTRASQAVSPLGKPARWVEPWASKGGSAVVPSEVAGHAD